MRWAEIQELDTQGLWTVVQTFDYLPSFPEGVVTDECPDEVTIEWVRDNGVYRLRTTEDNYSGYSDDQLRSDAYLVNENLANQHIYAAQHEPNDSTTLDDRGTEKENKRRDNRAKNKGKLTHDDDILADYIDEVYDALDSGDDVVEDLDRPSLIAWDGSAIIWPIWNPPTK